MNQKVAMATLRKLGYRDDSVVNGQQVLTALEKDRYDVIFMDCQMPEMDGFTATQEIRKLDSQIKFSITIRTLLKMPQDHN